VGELIGERRDGVFHEAVEIVARQLHGNIVRRKFRCVP
jgi:hypothetical protein